MGLHNRGFDGVFSTNPVITNAIYGTTPETDNNQSESTLQKVGGAYKKKQRKVVSIKYGRPDVHFIDTLTHYDDDDVDDEATNGNEEN